MSRRFQLFVLFLALCVSRQQANENDGLIGINYGRIADDLPAPIAVVSLLQSMKVSRVKIFDANPAVLGAFSGSTISLTVAIPNDLLQSLAKHKSAARKWVEDNILPYVAATKIDSIAVGNEVFTLTELKELLVPAMKKIHKALKHAGLENIKVTTPVALSVLGTSFPPSNGSFKSDLQKPIKRMLKLINKSSSYVMVNVYPFFAYESNSDQIPLDYALMNKNSGVHDDGTGLTYENLFDAQLDAFYAAMARLNFSNVELVVSETGWPSKGDPNELGASVRNATAYNRNLVKHIISGRGTPLKPNSNLTVFIFALFNEDQKPGPMSERNFGLFYPDGTPVYKILNFKEEAEAPSPYPGATSPEACPNAEKKSWCVAKDRANQTKLQEALDYACGYGGADCRNIQVGEKCHAPDTLEVHASYAFNDYYQKYKDDGATCDFGGTATLIRFQPKIGECTLEA